MFSSEEEYVLACEPNQIEGVTYKLTLTPAPDVLLDGIGAGVRTCDGNMRRVLHGNSFILFRGTHLERRQNHVSQFVP